MKKIVLLGALALGMLTAAGSASAADYPPCSATVRDNCVQGVRSASHHMRQARHHEARKHHAAKKHHVKRSHHATHHRAKAHRAHHRSAKK
ncbi:hypothetical protein [uncultured Sphingomonas sp.]|uniref:hypothetical protein n=1 Tax=uncultured Sphingomonas sp. TaxID=158754 RepID=UPI00261BB8F3|nr:hypothetical protein [uncultured Sphingomonas sp.]